MKEEVVHPRHYNTHPTGIECIEIIQHYPANIAFAMKYCWRAGQKDGESLIKDYRKAIEYLQFEIDRLVRFELGKDEDV